MLGRLLNNRRQDESARPISVFVPELQELIQWDSRCRQVQYDLFDGDVRENYNYVRCMNVLNRAYFSAERLKPAVERLLSSLEEGGILQIGLTLENEDETQIVSFYRKTSNGLKLVRALNGGSELDDIVISG